MMTAGMASVLTVFAEERPNIVSDVMLAAAPAAQLDARDFANPPPDNRPAMLWFWKDTKMTPALIDEQLDLMKGIGIYRVNIYQRGSGARAYADDEWYPLIEHTLRAAEKRGMRIWLANESRASAFPIVTQGGRMSGKDYSLEAIQLANRLAEQGGSVVLMSKGPTKETNGRDSELAAELKVLAGKDKFFGCADTEKLKSVVREQKWPEVALQRANDKIRVLHRRTENADAYLLFNEGETAFSGVCRFHKFHTQGNPQVWDPDTGKVFEAETNNDGVQLRLGPYQLLAVVFTKGSPGTALKWVDVAAHIEEATPIKLNTGWTFKFDKPGKEPKPIELGDWTKIDPKFSGAGVYACEFTLPGETSDRKRWILDLGAVKEVAEVEVNGQKAGRLLWRPYRLDMGKYAKPGVNRLVVRVANTTANSRGDRRVSGLLGPVKLISGAE